MPSHLYCLHRGSLGDENVYATQLLNNIWQPDEQMGDYLSAAGPATAAYQGKVFVVYRGKQGDPNLWWFTIDPNVGSVSESKPFPASETNEGPALCVHNNILYCAHKGNNDNYLWFCSFDTTNNTWTADQPFTQNNRTNCAPALISWNNEMYCVHKGASDNKLWWCRFTGNDFTPDTAFSAGNETASPPALAVYANGLICAYRGANSDTQIYWSTFNGSTWTAGTPMADNQSNSGPALAVFNNTLYCAHIGVKTISGSDIAKVVVGSTVAAVGAVTGIVPATVLGAAGAGQAAIDISEGGRDNQLCFTTATSASLSSLSWSAPVAFQNPCVTSDTPALVATP